MVRKEVFFAASFLLFFWLTEIKCQKISLERVENLVNGSITCNFSLKYEKVIDPKKLSLIWYNPLNLFGTNYTLDVASEKLMKNWKFWQYPSLNIYVHGYGYSPVTIESILYKNAFLSVRKPFILLDYSAYSGTSDPGFLEACLHLYNIGEVVSEFLIKLVDGGVKTDDIHLIGLSLGGQLVGNIARAFQRNYDGNLGRVTGIDPSGPCFDRASLDDNLKKEDADFVDIYSFNRGQLSTVQILGHANFLINGGGPKQQSCEALSVLNKLVPIFTMGCAHFIISTAYWETSILDILGTLKGTKCDNLDQAVNHNCNGNVVNAGLYLSLSTRGIFYVYFDANLALTFSQAALTGLLPILAN